MKANRITIIINDIEMIERRYNPENDTVPGQPSVTWTDNQLLNIARGLVDIVRTQQEIIDRHEALIDRLFGNIEQLSRR